jgi:iron complex transport system substrate-binding protein
VGVVFRRLTFLSLVAIAACAPRAQQSSPKDDMGRPVSMTKDANRVVSLAPSITELVFAIGGGSKLVGRSKWDEYPPEAASVPSVGDGLSPNVEAVAATKPDLVLLYASSSNATALEQFDHMGIEALNYHMDHLDDVPRLARTFGRLLGLSRAADEMADRFERQLDSARRATRAAGATGPSVVLITWTDPPNVLGREFLSEMVELAGGRNVFGDLTTPSAYVTIETIAARKPEAIIVIDSAEITKLRSRPEWRAIAAIKNRRFVVVHGTEFGQPSFRALKAVEQLKRAFAEQGSVR